MTDSFTPGPWRWRGWGYGGEHFWGRDNLEGFLTAEDGTTIITAGYSDGAQVSARYRAFGEGIDSQEAAANARLIEQSPALLSALRNLVDAVTDNSGDEANNERIAIALADAGRAIQKATGEGDE